MMPNHRQYRAGATLSLLLDTMMTSWLCYAFATIRRSDTARGDGENLAQTVAAP
jgi:hypothetical protein